jgi:hypothetical protein
MPKAKLPTKKELMARGFTERQVKNLIDIFKEMNKLTDAEQQMILAALISRYLDSTPPMAPR